MPNYEIVHWNAENFDVAESQWVREAVERKMWAFATDYIRFWALQKYGGIYLDTDVQVIKPFDELLTMPYFLGMEQTKAIIEAAVLGVEINCPWANDILAYYTGRNFVANDGMLSTMSLPQIMLQILGNRHGFDRISSPSDFDTTSPKIQLLPPEYFSPKRWDSHSASVTENTYCIHHFEGSWTKAEGGSRTLLKNCRRNVLSIARTLVGKERWQNMLYRISTKGQQ